MKEKNFFAGIGSFFAKIGKAIGRFFVALWKRIKEFFRKRMVALKRSPQNIPMVALVIAFLYYSLNLGHLSDTTENIMGLNMGLSEFATMLFSILVFVCFLNSFPKRKKPNYVMIALMYIMFAIIIAADFNYRYCIIAEYYKRAGIENEKSFIATVLSSNAEIMKNEIVVGMSTGENKFVGWSLTVVTVHVILVIIVAVLVALIPVYGKLLRKINTNVDLEYSNNLGKIDVDEE